MAEWRAVRTHVSWLVFTDRRVYKGKRPVVLDFVDLRTPAARLRACRREVELNRRLAPDVYHGLGRFTGADGRTEPVVVMERMPAHRALSHLVRDGDPRVDRELSDVATLMARFHRDARRDPLIDRHCRPRAVKRLWEESLATVAGFPRVVDPGLTAEVRRLALSYLAGRGPLLKGRIAAGRAVDGHGDLLADDIFCLDDGPRILDCLEFDDRLRHLDPLADLASLAMDLERLGRADLGGRLLQTYTCAAGDRWPVSLAHHWIAYRALVRAKVACIRASELGSATDVGQAGQLSDMAREHLRRGEVRLVLVGGLPGAGKSRLAGALARATGFSLLRSDSVRKERGGIPSYTTPARTGVYRDLTARAEVLLGGGASVVLDATWSHRAWRQHARSAARRASARVVELECRAPVSLRAARAERRAGEGRDPSDAGPREAERLAVEFAPWPEAVALDTGTRYPDTAWAAALAAVGPTDAPE